jgi:hypothetical protein
VPACAVLSGVCDASAAVIRGEPERSARVAVTGTVNNLSNME